MESELKSNLVAVSNEFLVHCGLAPSTVWMRAASDARFFDRIEAGGGFTVKTYDRVMAWFSENWPDGATWPDHVDRPNARNLIVLP